jgi:3-phenylpropionate/cinnamic acid dioxygenase small subunit
VGDERSIADELDVQRVLHDYAWACDNKDWDLLSSVFTADARLDYSSTGGPAGGREEVTGWLRQSLTQIPVMQHVVTNFQVGVTGDHAAGRAMFLVYARVPGLVDMLVTGGYYDLALRQEHGEWKIERLAEDNRWMTPAPPPRP